MQPDRCERCGAAGTMRLASVGAWTCTTCATAISQEHLHARRRQRSGRATVTIAHAAIRRTERPVIGHLRLN